MGKITRIAELEGQVKWWRERAEIHDEVKDYLKDLAELPEDAVMYHNIGNQVISHAIGKSARILWAKVYGN